MKVNSEGGSPKGDATKEKVVVKNPTNHGFCRENLKNTYLSPNTDICKRRCTRCTLDPRTDDLGVARPLRRLSNCYGEAVADAVGEADGIVYLERLTSTKNDTARYGIEEALKSKNLLIFQRKCELIHLPDGVSSLLGDMALDTHDYEASVIGYYQYWCEARGQTVYSPRVSGSKLNPYMRINKVYAWC